MKAKAKEERDQPQIEIPCPHCGGASEWDLLQKLNQCAFCGSVLSWPYPEGEPDYLVAESVIRTEKDLVEVLAMYDAMREASRRRGAMRSATSGDYEPDLYVDLGAGFSDTSVYEIKRERIHLFRILKSFCVYAPYQLITSLLAFHVLGRITTDQKVFRTLFFSSEAILPGYTNEWNFRDRGLRMSRQKLKPLTSVKWNQDQFLATGVMTKEIEKVTRQWTSQRRIFESEIQPICFEGTAVDSHRWWVYRPYYFVHAQTPQGSSWFLLDGQFGTMAGTPTVEEVGRVMHGNSKKLDLRTVRTLNIRLVPFRCPNCGWDVKLRKGLYQICDNCTRVLEVNEEGLRVVSYATLSPEQLSWWPRDHRGPKVWLPFWRLELSMFFEKQTYKDLVQVMEMLVPAVKQEGDLKTLFVPAFDCWTIAKYDHWAFEFAAHLSRANGLHHETTLHDMKSVQDPVVSPGISRDLLPMLFPHIAAMYTTSSVQARLNTLLIKRLSEMHVLLQDSQLVFVPAALSESRGREPKLHGPKQPVDWSPFKDGNWPPMLQRTVRRWKAAQQSAEKSVRSKTRKKWMTS